MESDPWVARALERRTALGLGPYVQRDGGGTPVGRLRSMNGTFWSTSNARAPLAGPGAGRPWGRLPSPCCCPFQVSTPGLGRGGFSCKRQTLSARSCHRRPRKGRPSTPHAVREPPRRCPGSGGSRDAAGGSASDAGAEDVHRGPCPTRGPRRGRRAPEVQGEGESANRVRGGRTPGPSGCFASDRPRRPAGAPRKTVRTEPLRRKRVSGNQTCKAPDSREQPPSGKPSDLFQ